MKKSIYKKYLILKGLELFNDRINIYDYENIEKQLQNNEYIQDAIIISDEKALELYCNMAYDQSKFPLYLNIYVKWIDNEPITCKGKIHII